MLIDGWGGRIRTYDGGIKTRCLTTWLHPIASRNVNRARQKSKQVGVGPAGQLPASFYSPHPLQ